MKKKDILRNNGLKKRYKYLYVRMLDEEVIYKAFRKMSKGKRKRLIIQNIFENIDRYIYLVKTMLYNTIHDPENGFNPPKHKPRYINEYGKERIIFIPSIIEQWVHHIIMQVLAPIFIKTFYHNSFGSVPGKGLHRGGKLLAKWRSQNYKYVYKLDVRHFYQKIRLDILIKQISEYIADEWMIRIIRLCFKWFKLGLPLGFYLSQWLANVYLTPIDNLITSYGLKHIRYVDDIVVIGDNKRKLRKMLTDIIITLGQLRLRIKGNHKLMKATEDISYLGFVFKGNQMRLRKNIAKYMRKVAKSIYKARTNLHMVWIKNARRITSMMGWISKSDSYHYYEQNIKPYAEIRKLKHIISKYDKKVRIFNYGYDTMDIRGTRPQTRAA